VRLREIIDHSRRHLARRQRNDALKAITEGMAQFPQDRTLPGLLNDLVKMTQTDAERARTAALNTQAQSRAEAEFKQADAAFRVADALKQSGQSAGATRGFLKAEELYNQAAARASQVAELSTKGQPQQPQPPVVPTPDNNKQSPVQPRPETGKQEQPQASGKTGNQTPPQPPPQPQPQPAQPVVDEKTAIQQTLNRLAAAYHTLDTTQVASAYPGLGQDELNKLREVFKTVTSYELFYRDCTIADQGTRATATCSAQYRVDYKVLGVQMFSAHVLFRLEKRGGSWVIVDRQQQS